MFEIVYAPIVQEKLAALKTKLTELCGEKQGVKRLLKVVNGFEVRLAFSNTGIPVKTVYDVGLEGAGARREDRSNMYYPFYYNIANDKLSLDDLPDSVMIYPHLSDGSNVRWRWGQDTTQARIQKLVVPKVRGCDEYDIFQKDYLPEDGKKRVKPKSFWNGTEFSAETGTLQVKGILGKGVFEIPKPTGIVEYILQQSTDSDSIVLDFFAGFRGKTTGIQNYF